MLQRITCNKKTSYSWPTYVLPNNISCRTLQFPFDSSNRTNQNNKIPTIPARMDGVNRVIITGFLVWFLVFASADTGDAKAASKSTYNRYWERVKSTINHLQVKYLPPDLDFRSIFSPRDKENSVKEAAAKSFQASKKTVEETAKSAASVVEEAAHVTAEKVKAGKTPTSDDSRHSEL